MLTTDDDIDNFCKALHVAHSRFPDQRIGQLISNAGKGDLFFETNYLLTHDLFAYVQSAEIF